MAHQGAAMTRRVPRPSNASSASPAKPPRASLPHASAPNRAAAAAAAAGTASRVRRSLAAAADFRVGDEGARTRLIGEICSLLHEPAIPESARSAGLELIGWLARRMPGEAPHALGVEEALEAKRTSRRKVR
jgi:hypothetical protein